MSESLPSYDELARRCREAEAQLERLQPLYDSTPLPYHSLDVDGRILDVNPAWLHALGYERDEVIGAWFGNFVHQDSQEKFRNNFPNFIQRGTLQGAELMLRRKDGAGIHVVVDGRVVYAPDGKAKQTSCIFKDVTAQKQAEAELKTREAHLQAILSTTSDGYWVVDLTGRHLDVNETYCRLVGYSREELLTMSIADIDALETPADTAARMQRIIENGSGRFETRHRGKDGSLLDVEISVTYLPADGGRFVCFSRDITERKHNEETLRTSTANLNATLNATADGILAVGGQGQVLFFNRQFTELWRVPQTMLNTGEDNVLLLHALTQLADPDAFIREVQRLYASNEECMDILHFMDGRIFERYSFPMWPSLPRPGRVWSFRDITDRTRAEEALRHSETRFKSIFEQFQDVYYEVTLDGIILEISPSIKTVTGYTREELLGTPIQALYVDPDTRRLVVEAIKQQGYIQDMEILLHDKNGVPQHDAITATLVYDADGCPWKMYGTLRDITPRIHAEQALRASEVKFQKAFRTSPDAININRVEDGSYVEVNEGFIRMSGYTAEEAIGRSSLPGDLNIWVNEEQRHHLLAELHAHGEVTSQEALFRRKDGTVLTCLISARFIEIDGEQHILSITRDITERKQMEIALRQSEERFKHLSSVAREGIMIQVDGVILDANQTFAELIGYAGPEMLIGKHGMEVIKMTLKSEQMVREHLLTHTTEAYDIELIHPDGQTIYAETRGRDITYQGRPARLVYMRDITERKQAEEALQASEYAHRSMVANISDVIAIIDPAGICLYVSPNVTRWFGWYSEDMVGANSWDVVHPDDLAHVQSAFSQVLTHQFATETVEYRFKCKDGSYRTIEITCTNLLHDPYIKGMLVNFHDITERKQAEETLRLKEARLAEAQRTGQVGSYEFHILENNWTSSPVLDDIFGINGDYDYTVEGWLNLVHPDDRAVMLDHLQTTVLGARQPFDHDYRIVRPVDGAIRWVHGRGELFCDAAGTPHCLTGMIQDVTERKHAEEKLHESESRYRTLFNEMTEGFALHEILCDKDGIPCDYRFLDVNPSFEALTGLQRASVLGRLQSELLPQEDPKWVEMYGRVALTGEPCHFENYSQAIKRHFEVYAYAPAPRQFAVLFVDITERKRAEEALRESELRFRTLLEQAPVAISISRDGIGHFANQKFRTLFGLITPESIAQPISNYYAPQLREESLDRMRRRAQGLPAPSDYESIGMHADGTQFPMHVSVATVNLADGVANIAFITDISARKRVEEEREKLQAQLIQAQKMESIGRLAGGVAHDFNNMLGVILGYTELAMMKISPDQPMHGDLVEIKQAAERSADLTRQLLAFARKQTVSPKVLDLNETISGMLKMLRRLIGEDIHLEWLRERELWPVNIDPAQIDQILANLCVNARDAINGVGKVTIETSNIVCDDAYCAGHAGVLPGDYVLLTISDDGCGMTAEIQGHLFEPFFTTKGIGEGTGLGLATVYGVVNQNHGFINVYSEPGRGTSFKIYLPRHTTHAAPRQADHRVNPGHRGHETVLLVEDELSILSLGQRVLSQQGYQVLTATTPGAAIQLAQTHPGEIHLVITDVIMPEMNGRELAKRLLSIHPNLKRLFMSGYTANVIAHHGVLDQGVNFLQKPFTIHDLAAKVRKVLDE